ncbi:MAG: citrate lyase acyl carrier protein [Muribaculaceae bacterium]|nr:citrate lyase acyl carrier protein [Muribaculaceae bacterium]
MNLTNSQAGTLESGDIVVRLAPGNGKGLEINLDSTVAFQFGRQIEQVIRETLTGLGIDDAVVDATDKGALDCTIRARTTAAAVRATGKDVWQD